MTRLFPILALIVLALLAGCASEDENIVNPPPGNANVVVRLFNMVPDEKSRQLVMEAGYQTTPVGPGGFSAPVNAPADSSFLEIYVGGDREYRSDVRARFIRQSVYNVYAVASHENPNAFDTVVLSNANRSLTTQPVAQVRAVNLIPDTTITYDVRIGCPNGDKLSSSPVSFRQSTLYSELPPGFTVFSISRTTPTGVELLGTYECVLKEFTPYTIVLYQIAGSTEPQLMLFEESDLSADAERSLLPIQARDSDVRVLNLMSATATVEAVRTGQIVESNLGPDLIGSYESVPTCESTSPDVFELRTGDGRVTTDSTSLTVRGKYTVIAADDSTGDAAMVLVPPQEPVFGAEGKARIRVASATNFQGGVSVSIGARTDITAENGLSNGQTLVSNIAFDQVSGVTLLTPGEIPISVRTSSTPSTVLAVRRMILEPDTDYLLLVGDGQDGSIRLFLIKEEDAPGTLTETESAAFVRFVNGAPQVEFATASVGSVLQNARVFYRGSLATNLAFGTNAVSANGASYSLVTMEGLRSMVVYTVREGSETIFEVTTPPLEQNPAFSQRRVVNATGDVDLVSVAYDTLYTRDPDDPDVPHVARKVPFGEASPVHTLDREVRGSMYVYNYDTRETLYNLPIDLGPLGNSYSLIVVGTKEEGYEVVVLQEF